MVLPRHCEATATSQALERAASDRLPAGAADLVRLYYGIDGGRAWTKRELADRFGLTIGRVERMLQQSVQRLLNPSAAIAPCPEVALQRKAENIGAARRQHGRPSADELHALEAAAFDGLSDLERTLVLGYYGIGEERPWTRRELGSLHGLQPDRVRRPVNAAVRQLLGA